VSVFQFVVISSFVVQLALQVGDFKIELVIFPEQLVNFSLKFDILLIFEVQLAYQVLVLLKSYDVLSLEILSL
jgi:hypothetical protein